MVRFIFKDSGEIKEWDDRPVKMARFIKTAVSDMVWFREYFRELCSDVSLMVIEEDGQIVGFISLSDYFLRITKVYSDGSMVECSRNLEVRKNG